MNIFKKTVALLVALCVVSFANADDWDDFGGEDFGISSEPEVTISGSAEMTGRVYTDLRDDKNERGDVKDFTAEGRPAAKLNFDYSGSSSDVAFKLKFDKFSLGDYKEDILDEFTARAYIGNFQIEAGKMKVVWGKGDKIHVVDNFNANDYTDFIMMDYIDRRLAEPMFRVVYSTPENVKIEGIITPMMTADRLAEDGIWQPAVSKTLTSLVEGIVQNNLRVKFNEAINSKESAGAIKAIMNASDFSSSDLVEDNIHSLKYGQAGARTTFTLGQFDLGFSYYYGHYKQPSLNLGGYIDSLKNAVINYAESGDGRTKISAAYSEEITATATKLINDGVDAATAQEQAYMKAVNDHGEEIAYEMAGAEFDLPTLNYNQLQVFGLEAATVIWKFNVRTEAAYYLTEDTAGDNPWIENNSIQWVAGFDMDMPWTNMNLNVQTQGKYILNSDKIKDGKYSAYDVDYNSDDNYLNNKIIVAVTDTYNHENIKLDIKGIFEVETKDFVLMPSVSLRAVDDFSITLKGMLIKTDNENSEFYNFRCNSFAQISCKYLF